MNVIASTIVALQGVPAVKVELVNAPLSQDPTKPYYIVWRTSGGKGACPHHGADYHEARRVYSETVDILLGGY